jgi:hypothetical protein
MRVATEANTHNGLPSSTISGKTKSMGKRVRLAEAKILQNIYLPAVQTIIRETLIPLLFGTFNVQL